MFRFFIIKKWLLWSWLGSFVILSSLWVQVKIDVKINEWFGKFYDMIQKALSKPNSITIGEYWESLFSFITLAGLYILVYVLLIYFTNHYLFSNFRFLNKLQFNIFSKHHRVLYLGHQYVFVKIFLVN